MDAASGDLANLSQKKPHCWRSDIIRTPEYIDFGQAAIDKDPGKSIKVLGRESHVVEVTIPRRVHEYLRYKVYVLQREQFIF